MSSAKRHLSFTGQALAAYYAPTLKKLFRHLCGIVLYAVFLTQRQRRSIRHRLTTK
jgi:hypothetical protein